MADNDDKLLQINRVRYFDGDEEYMLERENRDLGAKFMEYLRTQDTPLVVELKVDVFPATELGVYYENVRTRLQVKKVKTPDVPYHSSSLPEFDKVGMKMSPILAGAIILLGAFGAAGILHWIYSMIVR